MRKSLKSILCLLAIFTALPLCCSANQLRVARVTDGDTIKVVVDHMKTVVRLVGIDAPELGRKKNEPGQPFSRKATKYLAKLVLNKTITLEEYGTDRYGRTLAVVFVDGKNANLEMVKAGLAEVYRGKHARYFNPKIYQEAEDEARKADRGMWVRGDKYISPREWRRMRHNGL
jgi:endonuclease YncB( thermonuclease family)